jgi:hypothetical protein
VAGKTAVFELYSVKLGVSQMEPNKNIEADENSKSGRREAMQKLGRFAAYAAPFTVLAVTKKADAATGHGPGRH